MSHDHKTWADVWHAMPSDDRNLITAWSGSLLLAVLVAATICFLVHRVHTSNEYRLELQSKAVESR